MSAVSVGSSTAVLLSPANTVGRVVIQNLGGGNLYIDTVPTVTTTTGIKILPGGDSDFAATIGRGLALYAISDGASDVRIMAV